MIREERPTGVPFVIEKLTAFILENCMTTPGIFRVAGSALEIQALKQVFDDGGSAAVQLNLKDKNPYSVCDCLKLYFRSLPEPMLGYDLYRPIVELMSFYSFPFSSSNYHLINLGLYQGIKALLREIELRKLKNYYLPGLLLSR